MLGSVKHHLSSPVIVFRKVEFKVERLAKGGLSD